MVFTFDSTAEQGLDPKGLIHAACEETGLDDYGDDRFLEALTRWLQSVATEGRLTQFGLMSVLGDVHRILVNRLRFYADLKNHAEILEEDVSDPVVITGFPRSGTTKLQRIMACHPDVQYLPLWRVLYPAPLPGWAPGDPDPRVDMGRAVAEFQAQYFPEVNLGHPMGAELAEEDALLLGLTLRSAVPVFTRRVPSFMTWWLQQPRRAPYEFLRAILQYLQWQDGGRRGRPLVLKAMDHFGNLDLVAEMFPKCTIAICHRHPKVSVPSAARLNESIRRTVSDDVDPFEVGAHMLEYLSGEAERNVAQREALDESVRVVDVPFAQIVSDPLAVARAIYARHGMPLTADAERRMTLWQQQDPHDGTHSYSLEQYGLTESQIDKAFSEYIERFVNT